MSTGEDQQRQDCGQREICDGARNIGDRNSGQAEGGSGHESSFDETAPTEDHESDADLRDDEQNGKKFGMGYNNASDQFSSRAKPGRSSKAPVEFLTVPACVTGIKDSPDQKEEAEADLNDVPEGAYWFHIEMEKTPSSNRNNQR